MLCFQVRNITAFGAFVDIGVHTSGLIHTSKMRNQKLTLGNQVQVKIISMDIGKGRIGLKFLQLL